MRNLSLLTDPQEAAQLYGQGLRRVNMVTHDRYLSISRRDLPKPQYRITRNTSWTDAPDPWREKHNLTLRSGGIIADIAYSNQPVIIKDLSCPT